MSAPAQRHRRFHLPARPDTETALWLAMVALSWASAGIVAVALQIGGGH